MIPLSVIIPCYNAENYINRCLNSIINQTIGIENLEIILINDASTDNTLSMLLDWEQRYPEHILIINLPQNQKQGAARNIGLQYASGEFISFIDSDDWIEPTMYEVMLQKMLTLNCDLVQCRLIQNQREEYLSPDSRRIAKDILIDIASDEERSNLIASGIISGYPVSKLYRKKILTENKITFPENIFYEDIYFLGLLNLYVNRIYFIEETLYHYFYNINSTSRIKNHPKHYDILKVCLLRWQEYENRGVLQIYKDAFEYEFLERYYFTGIVRLLQNMDTLPYDVFLTICSTVKEKIPAYRQNPYVLKNCNSGMSSILLDLLNRKVSSTQWNTIENKLRSALY